MPDDIAVPQAIVRVLEEAGIRFVFGMPGGDTGRIFDALHDSTRIRTVLVRHEQVGSIMAEMHGRLTGTPGVVMGQGIFLASNALFGTLEAVKGASPMLLLGDYTDMAPFMHHAPYQAGTGEHGNHDLRNLLASATKYTAAVTEPKQAVQTVQLAIKHATTGTPGPVAVVFASRSLAGMVKMGRPPRVHATDRHLAHGRARPAAADVSRVAERLIASPGAVILAGNGVHAARAWSELAALAELTGAPVATTATGKSAMAEVHPLSLGVFGNWGQAVANEVVAGADTVLVVGSRLAPTDTCFENPELLDADRQAFLQIEVEPLNVGRHYPVAAAIVADAREALAALVAEVEARLTPARREAARRRREHLAELKSLHRWFAEPSQASDDVPLRPERVITELSRRLGERAVVTMDAGANRLYMTHYFQSRGAGDRVPAVLHRRHGLRAARGDGGQAHVPRPRLRGGVRRRRLRDDPQRAPHRVPVPHPRRDRRAEQRRARLGEGRAAPPRQPLHRLRAGPDRLRARGPEPGVRRRPRGEREGPRERARPRARRHRAAGARRGHHGGRAVLAGAVALREGRRRRRVTAASGRGEPRPAR